MCVFHHPEYDWIEQSGWDCNPESEPEHEFCNPFQYCQHTHVRMLAFLPTKMSEYRILGRLDSPLC